MLRLPDVTADANVDDLIFRMQAMIGLINGYSPAGSPTRFTQWDGLASDGTVSSDYANYRSTEETSEGKTFYDTNGLDELLLRGDNTGLYGETPTEFTNTLTVGLTSWLKGNVGMGVEPHATYDLTVADQVWIKGKTGIGGVPDTAVMLKVTGDQWITSKLGVGATIGAETVNVTGTLATSGKTAIGAATVGAETLNVTGSAAASGKMAIGAATVGTEQLVVTGLFQSTSRGGFGGAPDGTAILKATGAVIFTDDLTIDTDLLFIDKSARTLKVGATPSLYIDENTDFVGIQTTTPDSPFGVTGMMRSLGAALVNPTTGSSIDIFYNTSLSLGVIRARDNAGGTLLDMQMSGLTVRLVAGTGVERFRADATGIGFFATTPVAQQDITGDMTAPTLAALTAVVQTIIDAGVNYGLWTDSTT